MAASLWVLVIWSLVFIDDLSRTCVALTAHVDYTLNQLIKMLVLFETPAGYALFAVSDEKKLKKVDDINEAFSTPAKANSA